MKREHALLPQREVQLTHAYSINANLLLITLHSYSVLKTICFQDRLNSFSKTSSTGITSMSVRQKYFARKEGDSMFQLCYIAISHHPTDGVYIIELNLDK